MCHGNQEPCTKSEEQVSQLKRWYLMMIYREDINVGSKRINGPAHGKSNYDNIVYIDNSVIDASALNSSRLHLNAKGSSLLAVQFIKF